MRNLLKISLFSIFICFSFLGLAQLSGVGLVSAGGGGDFTSLSAAADAINSQGLSGSYTLQLAPGVYSEQITLTYSSGALTIESQSSSADDTMIQYFDAPDEAQHVIRLEGVSNFTLRNLTFDTQESENGTIIDIRGTSENFVFENNRFLGDRNGTAIAFGNGVTFFDFENGMHNLRISNNYFTLVSYAISNYFASDVKHTDILIENNIFEDADMLNINYANNVQIKSNELGGILYGVAGAYLVGCKGVEISNNIMNDSYDSIQLLSDSASVGFPLVVKNNFISGTETVLVAINCVGGDIWHNSFRSDHDENNTLLLRNNENTTVSNNIFYQANEEGSFFDPVFGEVELQPFQNNAWYTEGNFSVVYDTTTFTLIPTTDFEAFREERMLSATDINLQPVFAGAEDLHVAAGGLKVGLPNDIAQLDIDGDLRDPLLPTIGADEILQGQISGGLVLDTVLVLTAPLEGQGVLISWNATNTATQGFQGPWYDELWLSQDDILDADDILLETIDFLGNVNPNGDYIRQVTTTIPFNEFGQYYFIASVDAGIALFEDHEDNVKASAPIFIEEAEKPDLVVSAIQGPVDPNSGTNVEVEWIVTNQGDAPTSGSWVDKIYFSNDPNLFDDLENLEPNNASLIYVTTRLSPVGLDIGQSYTNSLTFELPVVLGGQHYFYIFTDINGSIPEGLSEVNNGTLSAPISIVQSPLPDLTITNFSAPATTFAGETIAVNITIENSGDANIVPTELPGNFYFGYTWVPFLAYDWIDYVYLRDTTLLENPNSWTNVLGQANSDLPPGESYSYTTQVQIPACVSGEYYIHTVADRWDLVQESVETNNYVLSDPIEVILNPSPDLSVTDVELLDTELFTGMPINFEYSVINYGPLDLLDADFNWFDQFYLSPVDSLLPDLFTSLSTRMGEGDVLVDDTYTHIITADLPQDIYGELYLVVFTDALNSICEKPFENNNVQFIPISITLTPAPDLLVIEATGIEDTPAGAELNLDFTIANNGEGSTVSTGWYDKIYIVPQNGSIANDGIELQSTVYTNQLPVGGTYGFETSVIIPAYLEEGIYTIYYVVDAEEQEFEDVNEDNNFYNEEINVTHDESFVSDLEVVEIVVPAIVASGAPFEVSYTVQNTSLATNVSGWYDKVFLENQNGVVLASTALTHVGALNNGETYTRTLSFAAPDGLDGVYAMRVWSDTSNVVVEYDLTNNTATTPLSVDLQPWPNLVPQFLVVPSAVAAGQEFTLEYGTTNIGAGPVQDRMWNDQVFLSTDNLLDDGDLSLQSFYFEENLEPLDNYAKDTLVRVPLTTVGDYFVIVKSDASNSVYEHTEEGDNYIVSDDLLTVTLAPPVDFDLVFEPLSDISTYYATFDISVTNTSGNPAQGSWTNSVYLSEDPIWDAQDHLMSYNYVGGNSIFNVPTPIAAGATYTDLMGGSVPPLEAGNYYFIIKYDSFNFMHETDETNNTFVSPPVFIDNIPLIQPDVLYTEELYSFDRDHFKIDVPEEFGLLVEMRHIEGNGFSSSEVPITDIKVSEEAIPTNLEWDFTTTTPLQEDHNVLVSVEDYERRDYIRTEALYVPPHYNPDSLPSTIYTLEAKLKGYSIYDVSPSVVGNLHNVTLRVQGFDFSDSLRAELRSPTGSVEAYEAYVNTTESMVAYFDTRGLAPGQYDLYLEKTNEGTSTLAPNVVEIVDGGAVEEVAYVQVPEAVRTDEGFTAKVTYGNEGLVNGYDYAIIVAFYSETTGTENLEVNFIGTDFPAEIDPEEQLFFFGDGEISEQEGVYIFSAYIPVFNNDFRGELFFDVNVPEPDVIWTDAYLWQLPRTEFSTSGYLQDYEFSAVPSMMDSIIVEDLGIPLEDFRSEGQTDCSKALNVENMQNRLRKETLKVAKEARGAKGFGKSFEKNLTTFFNSQATKFEKAKAAKGIWDSKNKFDRSAKNTPFSSEITDIFNCIGTEQASSCVQFSHPDPCIEIEECTINGRTLRNQKNVCKRNPVRKERKPTTVVTSKDPNEIEGPQGISALRVVEKEVVMPYKIWFENVAEAGAPAVRVRIDNPLPDEHLLQSFRLTGFGFADRSFEIAPTPALQQTYELGPEYNDYLLRLVAGVNPAAQKAFWEFTTIDPSTGEVTTDPFAGFLPPNDSTDVGQGWVTYEIKLKPDVEDGVVVENEAEIIFDQNEIIATNIWQNLVGEARFTSAVEDLPQFSPEVFEVKWGPVAFEGFSIPIERYNIYFQKDGGNLELWQNSTQATSAIFSGEAGSTYSFYSQGLVEGGGQEAIKSSADTQTKIEDFPLTPDEDQPLLVYPTPATDFIYLQYFLERDAEVTVIIYDVTGRKIDRWNFGEQEEGAYGFRVEDMPLKAGVFFVELHLDDDVFVKRGIYVGNGE